jgi:hypothetical protein
MRLLVCGGRDFSDKQRVYDVLDLFKARFGVSLLIHGDSRGLDRLAGAWADDCAVSCIPMPADWKALGRAAGPIRNGKMLRDGLPDVVIAFPGGIGTANLVAQARAAGVAVYEIKARESINVA